MQTFLPYPDLFKSVQCLDNKRLGKQRVEAYTILRVLSGLTQSWQHHPAVKMWRSFDACLEVYMNLCIQEWIRRGFKNTMLMCVSHKLQQWGYCRNFPSPDNLLFKKFQLYFMPSWFGNRDFHDSHKSNLLRKNPEHYKQFGWDVPNNLLYVWPVK